MKDLLQYRDRAIYRAGKIVGFSYNHYNDTYRLKLVSGENEAFVDAGLHLFRNMSNDEIIASWLVIREGNNEMRVLPEADMLAQFERVTT